jgi:GNAT superfamily N-acetyltransferase
MTAFPVHRAPLQEIDSAWRILSEYYVAAKVVARDSRDGLAASYFGDGAGVWLASAGNEVIGCVALRRLDSIQAAGEVKRLYVRPEYRGRGIAGVLYGALETYAAATGYQSLHLDTTDEMLAAQQFYESLGYVRCERYNQNPQATIFMRKNLVPHEK